MPRRPTSRRLCARDPRRTKNHKRFRHATCDLTRNLTNGEYRPSSRRCFLHFEARHDRCSIRQTRGESETGGRIMSQWISARRMFLGLAVFALVIPGVSMAAQGPGNGGNGGGGGGGKAGEVAPAPPAPEAPPVVAAEPPAPAPAPAPEPAAAGGGNAGPGNGGGVVVPPAPPAPPVDPGTIPAGGTVPPVTGTPTATPEPASIVLLTTGAAGLIARLRKRGR